jgi:hypothetical protein
MAEKALQQITEDMGYAPLKQRNSRKSSSEAITRENLSVKKNKLEDLGGFGLWIIRTDHVKIQIKQGNDHEKRKTANSYWQQ